MSRDEVKFISLEYYNELTSSHYSSVTELIFAPPPFEIELSIRSELIPSLYDLSSIIVVDEIPTAKIELLIDSKVYDDVRERLVVL